MEQYRKTPRANFIDYDNGDYFITICTKEKKHFFGEILNGNMILSEIGKFLDSLLGNAQKFTEDIEVPLYVVMPNHIHAIVCLIKDKESNIGQRAPNPALRANPTCQRHVPTLSKYINSLKGAVTKYAKANDLEFGWQSRYHDHLIRGTKDGNNISEYISNNVAKWQDDCFYK